MKALILAGIIVVIAWWLIFKEKRQRRWTYGHGAGSRRGASETGREQKLFSDSPTKRQTVIARNLMLHGEHRFFSLLCEALPNHHICPQVSFNALLTHAPHIWGESYLNAVRRKFHHKFVDFAIYDKINMSVVAVVEYDGSGHNAANDTYRDGMLIQAGYRVERFDGSDTLESVKVRFGSYLDLKEPSTQQFKTSGEGL